MNTHAESNMKTPLTHLSTGAGIPLSIVMMRTVALIIALGTLFNASAQIPIRHSVVPPVLPDSTDIEEASKKHFWRATAEVAGFNIGLWAFDRFVQHGDWAYISPNTVVENLSHGYNWDNDKLGTNTFLHPYNGSLFFNAGRSNGFNFWQSELFAIAGSAMWETFLEREYPSTNDIIATPIGGAVLGETLFRTSDAVIDDRTTGWERFGREVAIFALSPMRGINRIVTGEAWRVRPTRGRVFGTPNVSIRISTGLKLLEFQGRIKDTHAGFATQVDVEYGDRFAVKSKKPYDYFTVRAELQAMREQPLLSQLEIKGRLIARELMESSRMHASIGLYQHFDFYDSDTIEKFDKVPYKLGIPASIGVGMMYRDVEHQRWTFDCYGHANVVVLGSILSDHYWTDERNYNWASGFSLKGGFNFIWGKDKLSLSLNHEYYRLFSWVGYRHGTDLKTVNFRTLNVMGDHSCASFNVTEMRLDFKIFKRLYGTVTANAFIRSTRYRDYPRVLSSSGALRFMMTYKL